MGHTEIACVIDKSGSMEKLTKDTIGSFNKFLEEQKALPGEAKLSLTLFDTTYNVVYDGKKLADVPPMTHDLYIAGGWTALLDALGRTIDTLGERLNEMLESDRPKHVIVMVIPDGEENSSKEYTQKQVADKVKEQQDKYGWTFLFVGCWDATGLQFYGQLSIQAQSGR